MIVVIDTNVFISGVIRPFSKPAAILRLAASGAIQPAYDVRLLSEYREVLRRPKFGFSSDAIEQLLFQIQEEGMAVVAAPLKFHLPDPDEEAFLEVALSARASALVTGNRRHFPKRIYEEVRILSSAEFLEAWPGDRSA
jgi:uncharacterized protein